MTPTRRRPASPPRSLYSLAYRRRTQRACAKLRKRARGQGHSEAMKLLRTVVPHGEAMAKDLGRLLAAKDDSHYGVTLVDRAKARRLLGYARRITDLAGQVLAV